jgi:hypothetical protein
MPHELTGNVEKRRIDESMQGRQWRNFAEIEGWREVEGASRSRNTNAS